MKNAGNFSTTANAPKGIPQTWQVRHQNATCTQTLPAILGGPWALCVAVHQQATETTALGVATTVNLTSFPCGSTQSIRFLL